MNVAPERAAKVINARLIKERLQAIGVLLVGVVALGIALVLFNQDGVMCGSQKMEPGEVCTSTRHNNTQRRDVEEQAANNSRTAWILVGVGVLMAGSGATWAFGTFARKERVTPQQAAAGIDPAAAAKLNKRPTHPEQPSGGQHPPR